MTNEEREIMEKEKYCEINANGECDEEIICGCEGCRFYKEKLKQESYDK